MVGRSGRARTSCAASFCRLGCWRDRNNVKGEAGKSMRCDTMRCGSILGICEEEETDKVQGEMLSLNWKRGIKERELEHGTRNMGNDVKSRVVGLA